MPAYSRAQGVILTVGMYGGGERFQCVIPMIYQTLPLPDEPYLDFENWLEATIIPNWQAILAADMEVVGWQVEAMSQGWLIPGRKNYAPGTYLGTVLGESYSQNVSMLLAYYSHDQLIAGPRIITGHIFAGPPPEGNCQNRSLDPGFVAGNLEAFALAFTVGFTGSVSAKVCGKALSKTSHGANLCWAADKHYTRETVFTQKRRLTPIV